MQTNDNDVIPINKILPDKSAWPKIGAGAYGTVYKCYYFADVAVKVLNIEASSAGPEQIRDFANEVRVLRVSRHENIVLFYGYIHDEDTLGLVTQYCEGSTLYNHLHGNNSSSSANSRATNRAKDALSGMGLNKDHGMWTWNHSESVLISRGIANGMNFLHNKDIIHRDLKSPNIFLDGAKRSPKIGDFGLATMKNRFSSVKNGVGAPGQGANNPPGTLPTHQQVTSLEGSLLWMAPEIMKQEPNAYTKKSDIYAYGVVLFEIFAERLPFINRDRNMSYPKDMLIFQIGKGLKSLKKELDSERLCEKRVPQDIITMIEKCGSAVIEERYMNFGEICDILTGIQGKLPPIGIWKSRSWHANINQIGNNPFV